ncbi:cytochrome P450 6k1-like [Aricia agestis]|uniref:cytochrome P450 6k1-like n=1 Tax=Aricia agestis TaxID=91739 RepID=UPI001C203FF1|nr:cytochrome P450 6k1-like [Aricia agestis]
MITLLLIVLVSLLVATVYLKAKYNEAYWKKRGVAFYPRSKAFGIFYDFFSSNRSLYQNLEDVYYRYPNEPAVGTGSLFAPNLIVTDPTNIQHITSTDFNSFMDRSNAPNARDILANSLIFLTGNKWKLLRQSMTPLFTSAKLKSMYYIMDKSAKDFVPYIKSNPELKKGNAFSTLSTFCSAAIGAAVFGITTESVFDSPFLKMARKASLTSTWQNIKVAILLTSSFVTNLFNLKLFSEHENFFISAVKQIIGERKKTNVKRHDFGDLCVTLQDKGVLKDHDTGFEIEPTDEVLSAQAFFFFNAGVEPTATTMFNALVLLGQCPEAQERLLKEIDKAFEKTQGNISFDTISEMEYLDMVMNESMRIYPAIGLLGRRCVKDTTLPVGNIRVDKGTSIFIPLFALHRDERHYPEPEVFRPERFSKENKNPIIEKTFMPFGKGNRVCIGQRFAQVQAKAGIVHLLRNFRVNTVNAPGKNISFRKDIVALRLTNVDLEFIDR